MSKQDFSHIADFIKDFRKSRNWSLDELSKASEVSRSMICNIEMNKTSPTLPVLSKLANAMGVRLSELIDPTEKPKLYRQSCIDEVQKKVSKDKSFVCSLLSEKSSNRQLDLFAFEFQKKGKYPSQGHSPRSIETLVVEKGEMIVLIEDQRIALKAGDVLEFQGSKPHTYIQESTKLAKGVSLLFYKN